MYTPAFREAEEFKLREQLTQDALKERIAQYEQDLGRVAIRNRNLSEEIQLVTNAQERTERAEQLIEIHGLTYDEQDPETQERVRERNATIRANSRQNYYLRVYEAAFGAGDKNQAIAEDVIQYKMREKAYQLMAKIRGTDNLFEKKALAAATLDLFTI